MSGSERIIRRLKRSSLVFAPILILSPSDSATGADRNYEYYRSTDGQQVQRPTRGKLDYGQVPVVVGDGSRFSLHHHRGIDLRSNGVQAWR